LANPRESLTFSTKRASFAKSVGSFVPGLTRKSFEKYGFSTATLLTDWPVIAGADLASFTLPERLKWPRNVEAFEDTKKDARGRPGATLVLRVDGPRAIELQYQTSQIMERINAHFGYRAVSEIRFIQAPLPKRAVLPVLPGRPAVTTNSACQQPTSSRKTGSEANQDDASHARDDLLAALDRLHTNMTRAKSRSASMIR
jgi:hypothetical protein